MKRKWLANKFLLALLTSVTFSGALLGLSPTVQAADICEVLFEERLHALSDAELRNLSFVHNGSYERLYRFMRDYMDEGTAPPVSDENLQRELRDVLRSARTLLESQGARVRVTRYRNDVALEIIPDANSTNNWNRMASGLLSNHGTKLFYSPLELWRQSADGFFSIDPNAGNAVLISPESLFTGVVDRKLLHEVGHSSDARRQIESPHTFNGASQVLDTESREGISGAENSYRDFMMNEEVARLAQDLHSMAREIERTNGAQVTRNTLLAVARNARDVGRNGQTIARFVAHAISEVMNDDLSSGPVMASDGGPLENAAAIHAGNGVGVYVYQRANSVIEFTIETPDLQTSIFISDPRGEWSAILPDLALGYRDSQQVFQQLFSRSLRKWKNDFGRASDILASTATTLLSIANTADVATLAEIARRPRRVTAPLMAKPYVRPDSFPDPSQWYSRPQNSGGTNAD